MKYRAEVDGLRSVAVLPVILFHAGIPGFQGGFFGVDVFFVISGYLITTILVDDINARKFSIVDFYERRCRRILPALFFVVLACCVWAALTMAPVQFKDFGQSVVATMSFASNIYFYLTSGYFSPASEELPLLHTWSLAVEEQFYIFYPLILVLLFRYSKAVFPFLVLLSLLSFGSIYLHAENASASFYLIHTRAWELFIGGIISTCYANCQNMRQNIKELLSWCGLLVLLASLVLFTGNAPHPGLITLAPVIGTALLLAYSNNTLVSKLLAARPLVFIGLISYSLYLWHQPIFAFIRQKTIGEPDLLIMSGGIVVSVCLAIFSYHFVEKPFRNKRKISRKSIFAYSAAGLVIFIGLGLSSHITKGWPQRSAEAQLLSTAAHSPFRYVCHTKGTDFKSPEDACIPGKKAETTWAVLGDSLGVELAYALNQELNKRQQSTQQLTFSGCLPVISKDNLVPGCADWLNQSLDFLTAHQEISHVILAFRHTSNIYGGSALYDESELEVQLTRLANTEGLTAQANLDRYWSYFESLIVQLKEPGKQIYVLYPTLELEDHIIKYASPFFSFQSTDSLSDNGSLKAVYQIRRQDIVARLNQLQEQYAFVKIDPYESYCDGSHCGVSSNGKLLFFDNFHPSVDGAKKIMSTTRFVDIKADK